MIEASKVFNDSWQRLRASQTLLLGAALLALVGLAFYGILNGRTMALRAEQENSLRLADSLQAHVSALLDQSSFSLRGVEADLLGSREPDTAQQLRALRQAMRYDPLSAALGVVSKSGTVMIGANGNEVRDAELERRVRAAPEQPFQLLPVLRSPTCPNWCLILLMQGYERKLVALIDVHQLLGAQDGLRLMPGVYAAFATSNGERLFHYRADTREVTNDPRPVSELFLRDPKGMLETMGRISAVPTLFGFSRAREYPLVAIVGVPRSIVDKAWLARAAVPMILLLAATASIGFLSWRLLLARRSERRYLQEQRYLATHDDTTGLLNRDTFERTLQRRIEADGEQSFAVLLLGLNHFSEITETLGHQAADAVLKTFSQRVRAQFDLRICSLACVGDSEIAISFPLTLANDGIELGCQAAREALATAIVVDGVSLQMSTSIGIVRHPEDGGNSKELLRRADIALRAARNAQLPQLGFALSMDRFSAGLLALKADLAQALRDDGVDGLSGLSLVYQPKVELATGRLCGVEALARWQHPEKGAISPADFVPLAESCELIHPFTEQILHLALRQCAQWQAAGHRLPVAVNISVNNLMNADFVAMTREALERHGVAPELLEMEVTESALMRNPETALARLRELRALGVKLSIDDFGSGYASLAYLKTLPVDLLKIDRAFTTGLANDAANRLIVRWTIALAQGLGLKVVAEGVETAEEAELLRRKNCDIGQGYHFARPLAAERVTAEWLEGSLVDVGA